MEREKLEKKLNLAVSIYKLERQNRMMIKLRGVIMFAIAIILYGVYILEYKGRPYDIGVAMSVANFFTIPAIICDLIAVFAGKIKLYCPTYTDENMVEQVSDETLLSDIKTISSLTKDIIDYNSTMNIFLNISYIAMFFNLMFLLFW